MELLESNPELFSEEDKALCALGPGGLDESDDDDDDEDDEDDDPAQKKRVETAVRALLAALR